MLALLLSVPPSLGAPLDLAPEVAIALSTACDARDADACRTLAASSLQAWAASVVDNAWGNAEVADWRFAQTTALVAAACAAGDASSCRDLGDDLGACRAGEAAACTNASAPMVLLLPVLNEACGARPGGTACARLAENGWVGGIVTHVSAFRGRGSWRFGGDGARVETLSTGPAFEVASAAGPRRLELPPEVHEHLRGLVGEIPGGLAVVLDSPDAPHPTTALLRLRDGAWSVHPLRLPAGTPKLRTWGSLADGRLLAILEAEEDPASSAQVLALLDPATGEATVLAEVPRPEHQAVHLLAVGEGLVAWSGGGHVTRASLTVHGKGAVRIGKPKDLDLVTLGEGGEELDVADLFVATDGAVWLRMSSGRCVRWGNGAPVSVGEAEELAVVAGGRAALLNGRQLQVVDAKGAEVGRVGLSEPGEGLQASPDGRRLLLGTSWADVSEVVVVELAAGGAEPAWPEALPLVDDWNGTNKMKPDVPVTVMDAAGVPLAGLEVGWRMRTDVLGRGLVRAYPGEPLVVGYPPPPEASGLDLPAPLVDGRVTVRSLAERRAAAIAVGPGATFTRDAAGLHVTALDPAGLWASVLRVGDTLVVEGRPPPGGWTGETLWAAASARWPADGVHVAATRIPHNPPNGEELLTEALVLDGGPACRPGRGGFGDWADASGGHVGVPVTCPVAAQVGAHLRPWTAERRAEAELDTSVLGAWTEVQPAWDRSARSKTAYEIRPHGTVRTSNAWVDGPTRRSAAAAP
ncbi:MAG: hypothetical protein Q8P41_27720 [Pseudomonadota bacterium]|nr:hypothetical protein [Pseudomonadota bacterium]